MADEPFGGVKPGEAASSRAAASVEGALETALGRAGWYERAVTASKVILDPGPPPTTVNRRAFLARFNPAREHNGEYQDSDPWASFQWGDPVAAASDIWLSGLPGATIAKPYSGPHTRYANLLASAAPGDLIFVLRTAPEIGPVKFRHADNNTPIERHQPHLVGVWWVHGTLSWPEPHPKKGSYKCVELSCVPLVRFAHPVPLDAVRSLHPDLLAPVKPLSLPGTLQPLTAGQAFALTDLCSLPWSIFTTPLHEMFDLMVALRRFETGASEPVRTYLADAHVRWERTVSIERGATRAVEDWLAANGYEVDTTPAAHRFLGFDMLVNHPAWPGAFYEVEVKGTAKASTSTIRFTHHEREAARRSAKARDGVWWAAVVTKADTVPTRQPLLDAANVATWPDQKIANPGATRPLKPRGQRVVDASKRPVFPPPPRRSRKRTGQ